jgi:hypothetical protein
MNKFEAKTAELVELGRKYGFEPEVQFHGQDFIFAVSIRFNRNVYTSLSENMNGSIKVESYDTVGRRSERVSFKSLPDYLRFYSERGSTNVVGF